MTLTKAQVELLEKLEAGFHVTFRCGYYVVFMGHEVTRIWPSTFYGLFDQRMVERDHTGNYTISEYGKRQIQS